MTKLESAAQALAFLNRKIQLLEQHHQQQLFLKDSNIRSLQAELRESQQGRSKWRKRVQQLQEQRCGCRRLVEQQRKRLQQQQMLTLKLKNQLKVIQEKYHSQTSSVHIPAQNQAPSLEQQALKEELRVQALLVRSLTQSLEHGQRTRLGLRQLLMQRSAVQREREPRATRCEQREEGGQAGGREQEKQLRRLKALIESYSKQIQILSKEKQIIYNSFTALQECRPRSRPKSTYSKADTSSLTPERYRQHILIHENQEAELRKQTELQLQVIQLMKERREAGRKNGKREREQKLRQIDSQLQSKRQQLLRIKS